MTHTCQHDPAGVKWKFNGGNPWWLCIDCSVRVCGEVIAEVWLDSEDFMDPIPVRYRCIKPALHKEPCLEDL